jgi:omega-6 fatty acid desaturase (delta-12 desaturase)
MIERDFEIAQKILKNYAKKDIPYAVREFIVTVILLWGGIALSYYALNSNYIYFLFISIPMTVAFMCRSYVIEHDCGHQSFLRTSKGNNLAGTIMGFGIMIPYDMWKMIHDSHHKNVGNLGFRDFNPEIWTMTINEYQQSPNWKKYLYRFVRSRFARLIITPTINYGLGCRLIHPNFSKRAKISVIVHDIIYLILFWFLIYKFGFQTILIIYIIPLILFFGIAAFTFYGQHQFEDTYWRQEQEYDWKEATFYGASDISSPGWFRWLVGNVVCHSAHHIYTSIPFYRLHEAQTALNKEFDFKQISVTKIWELMGLKIWDPNTKKLVSFESVMNTQK